MSISIPTIILFVILHPMEPTHILIKEWLELQWTMDWKFMPFFLLFGILLQGCANIIIMPVLFVLLYFQATSIFLKDLTTTGITHIKGTRCRVQTEFFGEMEDNEVIHLYRIQRMLNVIINEILQSVLCSFTQVGMLATTTVLAFFAIKFTHVIMDAGVIAALIIGLAILAPLLISFYQSLYLGQLATISEEFKDKASKTVGRKMLFGKFARSCQIFYVEEAYPFYKIHKETFPLFVLQALDYTINLLLW